MATLSRSNKFVKTTLGLFVVLCVGIGSLYVVDIFRFKYPGSKTIRLSPFVNFSQESRDYCDSYHMLINLGWISINSLEKAGEIQSFYSEKLSRLFGEYRYLDNDIAYPIINFWVPLPKHKYFFIDIFKVYYGGGTDKYGSMTYVYAIDTKVYVGVFPKIKNSCPNKD